MSKTKYNLYGDVIENLNMPVGSYRDGIIVASPSHPDFNFNFEARKWLNECDKIIVRSGGKDIALVKVSKDKVTIYTKGVTREYGEKAIDILKGMLESLDYEVDKKYNYEKEYINEGRGRCQSTRQIEMFNVEQPSNL